MKKKLIAFGIVLIVIAGYFIYADKKAEQYRKDIPTEKTDQLKRKKYLLNKLWRDKAATQMEEIGETIHRKVLTDEEYSHQLSLKLLEEATEVIIATQALAQCSPGEKCNEDLTGEVGDVLEVLDCIIALHGLSRDQIEAIRDKKREERGSYLEREFVTLVEAIPGGYLHNYYLKSPDRHPELID